MNKIQITATISTRPSLFKFHGVPNCGRRVRFGPHGEIAVIAASPLAERFSEFAVGDYILIAGRLIFNPNTQLYGIVAETITAFVSSKIQETFFQAQRVSGGVRR
jgi:hypothetical protein